MSSLAVGVLARDDELAEALARDVREWAATTGGESVEIVCADEAGSLIEQVGAVCEAGAVVPIVFVELRRPDEWGVQSAIELQRAPATEPARIVLVTSKVSLHGVDDALKAGAVQGMLTRPWTRHGLARMLVAHLATYLVEHVPDRLDEFEHLFDAEDRARAHQRIAQQLRAARTSPSTTHSLLDPSIDDRVLERELIRLLDETLGHPPRLVVSPGTILIEAGEDVGGFYVVLDGAVRLSSSTPTGERILHERSTGAIIGLLSLATHRRALQQCRAITEVRAIPITLDQLARALDAAPELAGLLTRVLVSSLARRLRRSDQLKVELDESLAALSEARAQLVASARFATLGELSAGVAHELNNPTAALARSVEHLLDDVAAVVDDDLVVAAVRERHDAGHEPSSVARARRRDLARVVGDRARAERLIAAGAQDAADARRFDALDDRELDRLVAARRLGGLVRDVSQASERIQALVASLRAYARGEDGAGPLVAGVDVAEGIHHALGLLSHRLHDVDVDVEVDIASVPTITARPGALQQVWTNLIANALDALGEAGTLRITVDAPSSVAGSTPDQVRVRVHDDGPGIAPDVLPRIFEPRFTTKGTTVRFGLGLGLSISRQLVADHDGTIAVDSRPGDTTFTVTLPVAGPEPRSDRAGDIRRGSDG